MRNTKRAVGIRPYSFFKQLFFQETVHLICSRVRLVTGPLLTSSLLVIGQKDENRNLLRAFNKGDGTIMAEIVLPATLWGKPMSYVFKQSQYVVIATGEGANAKLIELALPL